MSGGRGDSGGFTGEITTFVIVTLMDIDRSVNIYSGQLMFQLFQTFHFLTFMSLQLSHLEDLNCWTKQTT